MAANARVGVATAKIQTDTSGFSRGREIIVRESRVISTSVKGIGTSIQNTERQSTSSLSNLQAKLKAVSSSMKLVSVAAAGIVTGGVAAAMRVKQLTGLFTVLSGSQQKANERMKQLRDYADETGQAFLDVASGMTAILPAAGRANLDMEKTASVLQRLAILDPAQGIEGAAFAVRELLGGTTTSLVQRFEFSRESLKKLKEEAKGDATAIIAGLDEMVSNMGLTDDAMKEMGKSGVNAFARARGAVTEAMATAFTPFLEKIVLPLVTKLGDFVTKLNETNPGLLQLAGTAAIVAAAIVPVTMAVSTLIGVFGTLKVAATSAWAAALAPAAVTVAAGVRGAKIGERVVKGIASQADDPGLQKRLSAVGSNTGDLKRIQQGESVFSVVGERLGQSLVIVVDLLLRGFKAIIQIFVGGAAIFKQVFEIFVAALSLGGNAVKYFVGQLITAVGTLLMRIGSVVEKLGGGDELSYAGLDVWQAGFDATNESQAAMQEAQNRLREGLNWAEVEQAANDAGQTVDNVREGLERGLIGLLGLGPKTDQAAQITREALTNFANLIVGKATEIKDNIAKIFTIESLTPPDFTDEQVEAYTEFQDKLKEVDDKANEDRLAEEQAYQDSLSDILASRRLRDKREAEDETIAAQKRDKSHAKEMAAIDTQANENIATIESEGTTRRAEINQTAQDAEIQAIQDYNKKRGQEERQHRTTLIEAAASLDAIAVANEMRRYNEQAVQDEQTKNDTIQKAQEQRTIELAELDKTLAERIQHERDMAVQQKAERQAAFDEQLADEAAARALQMQRRKEDEALELTNLLTAHQSRLAQIQAAAEKEKAAAQVGFIETFDKLASEAGQHQSKMLGIQQQGQAAMEQSLRDFWIAQKKAQLTGTSSLSGGTSSSSSGTTTKTRRVTRQVTGSRAGLGRQLEAFAEGGLVQRTGAILAHAGEYVLNKEHASYVQRMLGGNISQPAIANAITGGSAKTGPTMNIENIAVNLAGDIGTYSPAQIQGMVEAGFEQAFAKFMQQRVLA